MISKCIAAAAIVLALAAAGCAANKDDTDWWQKAGDPSKPGPMRSSSGGD